MIAKLASRAAKPRAGRTGLVPGPGVVLIEPDVELAFLHGHKVEALWGVGPATAKRLHELGVRTVGDLAAIPVETMVRRLGKASGLHLSALAHGEDPSPVTPNRPAKSIGHEETFSEDLVDPAALERHVLRMAESVATMLRGSSTAARTVTVKVKFATSPCRPAHTPWVSPSPPVARSVRWPPRCWRGSIRGRGSGCSASVHRVWSKEAVTSCRSTSATGGTKARRARHRSNSRGTTQRRRSTPSGTSSALRRGHGFHGQRRRGAGSGSSGRSMGSVAVGHHCSQIPWWCMSAKRTGGEPSGAGGQEPSPGGTSDEVTATAVSEARAFRRMPPHTGSATSAHVRVPAPRQPVRPAVAY